MREDFGGMGGLESEPASEDESVDAGMRCASWIETG